MLDKRENLNIKLLDSLILGGCQQFKGLMINDMYRNVNASSNKAFEIVLNIVCSAYASVYRHRGGGDVLREDDRARLHHQGGLQQELLQGLEKGHERQGEGGHQVCSDIRNMLLFYFSQRRMRLIKRLLLLNNFSFRLVKVNVKVFSSLIYFPPFCSSFLSLIIYPPFTLLFPHFPHFFTLNFLLSFLKLI